MLKVKTGMSAHAQTLEYIHRSKMVALFNKWTVACVIIASTLLSEALSCESKDT